MRTLWKGAISFGLVTIPITLHKATEDKTPRFRQLRAQDNSPIRYRRVADSDGQEVERSDIVRGFEVEPGKYVVFSEEELANARVSGGKRLVDVVQFVDEVEIDPIYYKSSFYLAPEETGAKAYELLLQSLAQTGRVGIALVAMREKQQLATLRNKEGVLVLETMFWPDEIREPAFDRGSAEIEIRPEEIEMAATLIEGMTREFVPTEYQDQTRTNIEALVKKKQEGAEIVGPAEPETAEVIDLMEALKASVAAAKTRGKSSASAKTKPALPESVESVRKTRSKKAKASPKAPAKTRKAS